MYKDVQHAFWFQSNIKGSIGAYIQNDIDIKLTSIRYHTNKQMTHTNRCIALSIENLFQAILRDMNSAS